MPKYVPGSLSKVSCNVLDRGSLANFLLQCDTNSRVKITSEERFALLKHFLSGKDAKHHLKGLKLVPVFSDDTNGVKTGEFKYWK